MSKTDGREDSLVFPALAALFGAETFDDLPMLVQQGVDVLDPSLRKAKTINHEEIELSLAQQLEKFVQFDECAAAGFVAIALFSQMDHIPGNVRSELNSLLELVLTKLEQKIA
ncbi:MAG TPA: hypothetical protein DCQ94_10915 [Nitrospira sp.]|nr:hypothetical protein [Nitrospira sp.]